MIDNRSPFLVIATLLLGALPVVGQEARPEPLAPETVPILSDLPVIDSLFRTRGSVSLPSEWARDLPASGLSFETLPFRLKWLMKEAKRVAPELRKVALSIERKALIDESSGNSWAEIALRIDGPPAANQRVQEYVAKLTSQDRQILIDMKVVKIPRDLEAAHRLPAGKIAMTTPAQLQDRLQALGKLEVISSPRLIVLNGQKADMSILNQVSYIRDFEVTMARDAVLADPVVDVIQEGLSLDVTPCLDADGDRVTMDIRISSSAIRRPIPEQEIQLEGIEASVTVQLPTVNLLKWEADDLVFTSEMRAAVVPQKMFDAKGRQVEVEVWITVRVIDTEAPQPGRVLVSEGAVAGIGRGAGNDAVVVVQWSDANRDAVPVGSTVNVTRNGDLVDSLIAITPPAQHQVFKSSKGQARAGDRAR